MIRKEGDKDGEEDNVINGECKRLRRNVRQRGENERQNKHVREKKEKKWVEKCEDVEGKVQKNEVLSG